MVGRIRSAKKESADDLERRRKWLEYRRAYYQAHKAVITERARRRRATDPEYREKLLARSRSDRGLNEQLKANYGISLDAYNDMLVQQTGVCAICEKKSARRLCVDHCHSTRVVRGLLCDRCNTGLGSFEDRSSLMLKAIAYLDASRGIRSLQSPGQPKDHYFRYMRRRRRSVASHSLPNSTSTRPP